MEQNCTHEEGTSFLGSNFVGMDIRQPWGRDRIRWKSLVYSVCNEYLVGMEVALWEHIWVECDAGIECGF